MIFLGRSFDQNLDGMRGIWWWIGGWLIKKGGQEMS